MLDADLVPDLRAVLLVVGLLVETEDGEAVYVDLLRRQGLAVDMEGVLDSRVTAVLREASTSLGGRRSIQRSYRNSLQNQYLT